MSRHNIRKRILNIVIALTMTVGMTLAPCTSVLADERDDTIAYLQQQEAETQETISNLEKQTKETQAAFTSLQRQKSQTESNVSNLQNQSAALQSTISGYSSQLDDLSAEINEAEAALAEVSAEIVELNSQLQAAEAEEAEQYALLKRQLQSTYESGGSDGMLMMLFTSGSIQDFLTKTEYVSAVVSYDQRKIAEFQALQADISEKKATVEDKQVQLDEYQATLDEKHEELAELTDAVKGQLNTTNSNINSEKGKLANYNTQLQDLDSKMKSLEAKTAAAQAALAQQIAERLALQHEDTGGSYAASATELEWLAATIQAEADGESYTGKLGVGSVIMNRVKSSAFPNSVIAVITQNMQFASYRSGKVELIIANGPNSTCIQAAQEVLGGARVGDYLFFMTKKWADYYGIADYTMIGNHAFFYRWKVNKPEPVEPSDEGNSDAENDDSGNDAGTENVSDEGQGSDENNGENSGEEAPAEESTSEGEYVEENYDE